MKQILERRLRVNAAKKKKVKGPKKAGDTIQGYVPCTSILQPAVNRQPSFGRGDS